MAKGKQTIWVGPADGPDPKPRTVEGICLTACPPGTLLKQLATGLEVQDNDSADFGEPFIVADKNSLMSKSITDNWTVDESMSAILAQPGNILNVLVADAQTLIIGDALSANATGQLVKTAALDGTDAILAYAEEALTTSGVTLVTVRAA